MANACFPKKSHIKKKPLLKPKFSMDIIILMSKFVFSLIVRMNLACIINGLINHEGDRVLCAISRVKRILNRDVV